MRYYVTTDKTVNVYSSFARLSQFFGFAPKKSEFTQRKLGNIFYSPSVAEVYSTQHEAREASSCKVNMHEGQAVPIFTIELSDDANILGINKKENLSYAKDLNSIEIGLKTLENIEHINHSVPIEKLYRAKIVRADYYSPLENPGVSATEFEKMRLYDWYSHLKMLDMSILKLRMKSSYVEYDGFREVIQDFERLSKFLQDNVSDDYKRNRDENMHLFSFLIDKTIQLADDIRYCSKQDPSLAHQSVLNIVGEYEKQINTEIKNAKDAANDNSLIKLEKIRSAIGAVIGAVAGFADGVKTAVFKTRVFGWNFKESVDDIWSTTKMFSKCYKHAELSSSIFSYFKGNKTRDKYKHKIAILSSGANLFARIKASASKLDESRKRDNLPMPSMNDATIEMKKRLYVTNR